MRLDELLDVYRRRREEAKQLEARADLAAVYGIVIAELEQLDVLGPDRMLTVQEVAELEGVAATTVRRRCQAGQYEGAEKTSGDTGDWRIPASALSKRGKPDGRRQKARRILDDDDLL